MTAANLSRGARCTWTSWCRPARRARFSCCSGSVPLTTSTRWPGRGRPSPSTPHLQLLRPLPAAPLLGGHQRAAPPPPRGLPVPPTPHCSSRTPASSPSAAWPTCSHRRARPIPYRRARPIPITGEALRHARCRGPYPGRLQRRRSQWVELAAADLPAAVPAIWQPASVRPDLRAAASPPQICTLRLRSRRACPPATLQVLTRLTESGGHCSR